MAVQETQTETWKTCQIGNQAAQTLYKKLESYWPFLAKTVYLDDDDYKPDFLAACADMTKSEVRRIFGHLEELAGEWPLGIARIKQLASKPTLAEIAEARRQIFDRQIATEDLHPIFYYARTQYGWELNHAAESKTNDLIERILVEAYKTEKSSPGSISNAQSRAKQLEAERLETEQAAISRLVSERAKLLIDSSKKPTGIAARAADILNRYANNNKLREIKKC